MSADSDRNSEQTVTEHSKDVTLVAYLKVPEGSTKHNVMQWLDHETDYNAKTERKSTDYYIEVDGESGSISEDAFKLMKGMRFNSLDLVKDVEKNERDKNGEGDFKRSFDSNLDVDWPETLGKGWEKRRWDTTWKDDVGKRKVKVKNNGLKSLGMLKHQSEATPDDRWEDEDGVYWAMYHTVSINDVSGDMMDELSDGFVNDVMTALARHPWVDTVRLRDCETTETKSGACYDVI